MDLRSFIEQLNERGQLHRIGRQVDWKYELGEMTRSDLAPLLFENIKDYPGHRVFTNGLISIAAIGLALAAEAGKSRKELVRSLRRPDQLALTVADGVDLWVLTDVSALWSRSYQGICGRRNHSAASSGQRAFASSCVNPCQAP